MRSLTPSPLRLPFDFELAFDNVNSLNDVRIRPDTRNAMAASAGATPGKDRSADATSQTAVSPATGPFNNVTLVEDGELLRFTRVVQAARDPDDVASSMMGTPGSATRPEALDLGKSKLVISIACPGEVVEHNADQVSGRKLTWEFELQELQDNQDRDWTVTFVCRREGK